MALPTNKAELSAWVLRELGEPVIRVNVSKEQVDDAIDTAMQFWQEYNEAGQERVYITKQVSETEIEAGIVEMPDNIQAVYKVIDPRQPGASRSGGESLFDVTFQFMSFNVRGFTGTGNAGSAGALSDFVILRQYMAELDRLFSIQPSFRFRHTTGRLFIDFMNQYYNPGDYILVEVQQYIPEDFQKLWANRLLRGLATAHVRKKWGTNLSKFTNIQLPSGMTLNGMEILQQANNDIEKYEKEIMSNGEPTGIIIA